MGMPPTVKRAAAGARFQPTSDPLVDAPPPAPTADDVAADVAALKMPAMESPIQEIARDLVTESGACAVLLVLIMPDGRMEVAALGAPGAPSKIIVSMREAVLAVARGDAAPDAPAARVCGGCQGQRNINGFVCIACGGKGVVTT